MPQTSTYNTKAAGEALKLIGGEKLMSAFLALYDSLVCAEQAGYAEGHAEGYSQALDAEQARAEDDTVRNANLNSSVLSFNRGYAAGHFDGCYASGEDAGIEEYNAYEDDFTDHDRAAHMFPARGNKQVEGADCDKMVWDVAHDWSLVKAAAALDEGEYRGG